MALVGGICEHFPRLGVLLVESCFGYVPYWRDALGWPYSNMGRRDQLPKDLERKLHWDGGAKLYGLGL